MSLYTYVPSKAELLDVMLDTVYGEQVAAIRAATTDGSRATRRAAERRLARRSGGPGPADWDLYHRHPWIFQMPSGRARASARTRCACTTRRCGSSTASGLPAREMVAVVDLVAMYVGGAARVAVEAAAGSGGDRA